MSAPRCGKWVPVVTPNEKIIALVAIKDPMHIDPAGVVARAKAMFPWIAASLGTPVGVSGQADSFVIPVGKALVAVMQIPVPIPKDNIARAIGKSWRWPQAGSAFAAAGAHLIVSSLQKDNDPRL